MSEQCLLVSDYSSLEVGIAGDFHLRLFGDDQTIRAYNDQARGIDMHSQNARAVFGTWLKWVIPVSVKVDGKHVLCTYAGQTADKIPVEEFKQHPYGAVLRELIKAVYYGMAYGKGAYGFSTLVGVDGKMIGEETAGRMVNALLDAVPSQRRWFSWVEAFVRKHKGIYSLGGRWCDLAEEMAGDEWNHKRAFRRAWNFPMQSTGADIIGDALVRCTACPDLRGLQYRCCLNVHDELVFRGPLKHVETATELVEQHMTNATANGVPLLFKLQVKSGHGPNYFEAK